MSQVIIMYQIAKQHLQMTYTTINNHLIDIIKIYIKLECKCLL